MPKKIPLSKGLHALVSDQDYIWALQWKWCASEQCRSGSGLFYAVRFTARPEKKKVWLHIEIAKRAFGSVPAGYVPDHGQGGTLDCTRENLSLLNEYDNKCKALRDSIIKRLKPIEENFTL